MIHFSDDSFIWIKEIKYLLHTQAHSEREKCIEFVVKCLCHAEKHRYDA